MSKNMTTCEFVRELYNAGIKDRQRIEDHACAAGYGKTDSLNVISSFRNETTTTTSSLYNIKEKYWCDGGGCEIPCVKLRDDDVQDDIQCAQKIMRQQGTAAFHLQCAKNDNSYWYTIIRLCAIMKNQEIPDYQENCGISWRFFWPLLIVGILINL